MLSCSLCESLSYVLLLSPFRALLDSLSLSLGRALSLSSRANAHATGEMSVCLWNLTHVAMFSCLPGIIPYKNKVQTEIEIMMPNIN